MLNNSLDVLPKVSVIVPVYNAERYLPKCLMSLKAQTLKEIEFILVDDCSTDNSRVICEEFAKLDSRFKVIRHNYNGGSSVARQTGLNVAKGKYVIICDADDWTEPRIYEDLFESAEKNNADISICDYFVNYDNGIQTQIDHYLPIGSKEEKIKITLIQKFPPASWVKLIRRDFMINNNIDYEQGINMGEDYLILVKMMLYEPRIVKVNAPLYHYRKVISGGSYTNSPAYHSFEEYRFIFYWFLNNLDNELYCRELFRCAINVSYLGLRIPDMPIKEHKAFIQKYCKLSLFLRYNMLDSKALLIILCKVSRQLALLLNKKFSIFFKNCRYLSFRGVIK